MTYKDNYYVNKITFYNIKKKQIKSNEYYKILFIFEGNCEINGDINLKREIKIVLF